MLQFLRIAARNLQKHRTRTLIIGGAITAVTAMLVLLLALTAGVKRTLLLNATSMASGHVNIAGFYKVSQTTATPMVTEYPPLLELARKEIPEAIRIVDRIKAFGKVISDSNSIMVPMWGIDMASEREVIGHLPLARKESYIENYQPKAGEPEIEGDLRGLEKPGNLVLFASHAKKLKIKVGDTVTVSMPTFRNTNNTKDLRIAAILQDMGMMSSFTTFAHKEDMREIYQMNAESTGQVMIFLRSVEDVAKVEDRLRKRVAEMGLPLMEKEAQPYWMKFERVAGESWVGQRIDITTWEDETSFVKWVLDILNVLTFVFIAILMAIVVLGLINNLWMAIRERTTEIGTLRAIGLQRRQVLLMFFLEAWVLSLSAVAVGVVIGTVCSFGLNAIELPVSEAFQIFLMSNVLTLAVQGGDLVLTFVLITFFLIAGSLYPSYRASKMKPISAINHIS